MSAPLDEKRLDRLCSMFDSFAKTALKNYARNLWKQKHNISKKVTTVDESMEYVFDMQSSEDTYAVEQYMIYADKFNCIVYSETLYKALLSLPENQRAILMLDFWCGWDNKKIAKYLEVTSRTVYNLRQRAYKAIREYYEHEKK